MCHCYIIFSKQLNRFYIGASQSDLSTRILNHNLGKYGAHRYTSKASDWELYLKIEVKSYDHVIRIERKIKSQKSSQYIRNLKRYPELLKKLVLITTRT